MGISVIPFSHFSIAVMKDVFAALCNGITIGGGVAVVPVIGQYIELGFFSTAG